MKKFNKILALGLVGASLFTGGFMLSGCDITEDKDKTQTEQELEEQKAVSAISINTDSLPSYIIKGKFSRTNIKATVTYEDNTTKIIDVTESMLGETDKTKLNYVGQYNLTINYGGKTDTMYANVVDERYLLKEVVEANLDKDVTIVANSTISELDMNNKIIHVYNSEDGYMNWIWLNNNTCYDYEVEDDITIDKTLATEFDDIVNDTYKYLVLNMLNGVTDEGRTFTINTINKVGLTYILTATSMNDGNEGLQYNYYFNEDFLLKVEAIDDGVTAETYNFNYAPITLEVPAEIKALESSATINVENVINDLKYGVMEDYLESDFEMSIFDNSSSTTYLYQQYDANNKILKEIDPTDANGDDLSWVNGDYYYSYYYATNSIYKYNISNWDRDIMIKCFTFDELFENCTVNISADGQYYELILPSLDGDGETWEYKYIFNYDEINKIEVRCNGQFMGYYTYNKTNVVLEVPPEIKALESSAQ